VHHTVAHSLEGQHHTAVGTLAVLGVTPPQQPIHFQDVLAHLAFHLAAGDEGVTPAIALTGLKLLPLGSVIAISTKRCWGWKEVNSYSFLKAVTAPLVAAWR